VLESLRRHVLITLLPVVLLVSAAVAVGLERTPEYTSEARLNVGGLNLTQQSIEGYTTAVQQLAVAYARSIEATGVVTPVAKELGLSSSEVVGAISATPIQGSPVISIRATAERPESAVRLADAAADSLVTYAITLNSGRQISGQLLDRFAAASREFRTAQNALDRAEARGRPREKLQTRVDTARLKMQAVGFLYQQSQAGQATTQLVQKLTPAGPAKSDREKVLKDLVAGALVAGLLIGVGLAVARANALARRRVALATAVRGPVGGP